MSFARKSRKIHSWGAILTALPLLVVIATGLLLQVKKQVPWVQPPTMKARGAVPELSFEKILTAARTAPGAGFQVWEDVERLDVRLDMGIVKVLGKNRWEVQLDYQSGEVLQTAYRRSDFIESLHDGSFFGQGVKLGVYLPSALILFVLWLSGLYLFFQPRWKRWFRPKAVNAPVKTTI